jgi:hypothetical protein
LRAQAVLGQNVRPLSQAYRRTAQTPVVVVEGHESRHVGYHVELHGTFEGLLVRQRFHARMLHWVPLGRGDKVVTTDSALQRSMQKYG